MDMEFKKWKEAKLSKVDLSRKGSVDDNILDLVSCINLMPQYFTTSSCSGRIIIIMFENGDNSFSKKGCKWLYVTHDLAVCTAVLESLTNIVDECVFKFEPMVMHIQCQSVKDAQLLHQAAVASGFRNSGLTVGNKGKIMVAVRSTHGLEVPLSSKGCLLVSKEYIEFLIELANKKMEENIYRINRLFDNVKALTEKVDPPVKGPKKTVSNSPRELEKLSSSKEAVIHDCDNNPGGEIDLYLEDGLVNLLFEDT